MANVLKREKQLQVIHMLVEGCSLRSIERVTGVQTKTLSRLTLRFGGACREFLDRQMRGLDLRHIQCDEIWTFVQKKQGRLKVYEKHSPKIGDMYLWIAFDEDTKLIPTFIIGKRSADMARRFMVDLADRLTLPEGNDTGERPGTIPQLSTDAFSGYREAVDLAFGGYVKYGQIIKDYRNADQPGRYGPPELIGTERREIIGELDPWSICTSHVERNNLTIRTLLKRFTRLSLCFSKKLENLAGAVAMYMAYYNFCWMHKTLRKTPAMAATVASHPWSIEELYGRIIDV